jgi:putative Mn2+ efflux pump MntP
VIAGTLFVVMPVVLGIAHAFDADHVAAVSALAAAAGHPGRALRLALIWGLGHSLPMLALAAIGVLLGVTLPPEVTALAERGVGVMLVVLGVLALVSLRARQIHIHSHSHGGLRHAHFHAHAGHRHDHRHTHAAVLTGAVHGLAGSGAAIALAPLGAAAHPLGALAFVALFGLAVAATMAAYAFGLGRLRGRLDTRSHLAAQTLRGSAALACVATGAVWLMG